MSIKENIVEFLIVNIFFLNENIIIVGKINGIKYLPCTPSTYDNWYPDHAKYRAPKIPAITVNTIKK